jgi:hypothetical protein
VPTDKQLETTGAATDMVVNDNHEDNGHSSSSSICLPPVDYGESQLGLDISAVSKAPNIWHFSYIA